MTVLIVNSPFFRVGQNLVSFFHLSETTFSFRIIRVFIWMEFHSKTPVDFFKVALGGISVNPEHFVIISFCHNIFSVLAHCKNTKWSEGFPSRPFAYCIAKFALLGVFFIVFYFFKFGINHIAFFLWRAILAPLG